MAGSGCRLSMAGCGCRLSSDARAIGDDQGEGVPGLYRRHLSSGPAFVLREQARWHHRRSWLETSISISHQA
jgi:hypothetical protein